MLDLGLASAGKLHLAVATLGLVIMIPGIAIAVSGGGEPMAAIGSLLSALSMVIFAVIVARNGLRGTAAQPAAA